MPLAPSPKLIWQGFLDHLPQHLCWGLLLKRRRKWEFYPKRVSDLPLCRWGKPWRNQPDFLGRFLLEGNGDAAEGYKKGEILEQNPS